MWVCRLPVHIGPRRMHRFYAVICGEFATSQRADVGIGPYTLRRKRQPVPTKPKRKPANRLRFGKEETGSEDKRLRA